MRRGGCQGPEGCPASCPGACRVLETGDQPSCITLDGGDRTISGGRDRALAQPCEGEQSAARGQLPSPAPCHLKKLHFRAAENRHPPFRKVTSAATQQSKPQEAGRQRPEPPPRPALRGIPPYTQWDQDTPPPRETELLWPHSSPQGRDDKDKGARRLNPKPCCPGHRCHSGVGCPEQTLALLQGHWHSPPHRWDVHSQQSSCQKPPGVKPSRDPRRKDAESRFFSKLALKRGLRG